MIQPEAFEAIDIYLRPNVLLAEMALLGGYVALQSTIAQSTWTLNKINTFSPHATVEVRDFAAKTVEYAHKHAIGAIALVDGSARPFAGPLIRAWDSQYGPSKQRPTISFLNPQGFQAKGKTRFGSGFSALTKSIYKGNRVESPTQRRTADEIIEDIRLNRPDLYDQREKPLLVMDTCLHSGKSIQPVLARLQEAGFIDVRLGVAHYEAKKAAKCKIVPDLVLGDESPVKGCYPFGMERLTQKTYRSVTSLPVASKRRQKAGSLLRQNIRCL